MNESRWEQARKSHFKRFKLLLFTVIPLLIIASIIIWNNNDIIGAKNNETDANQKSNSDITLFSSTDTSASANLTSNFDTTKETAFQSKHNLDKIKNEGVVIKPKVVNSSYNVAKDTSHKNDLKGNNSSPKRAQVIGPKEVKLANLDKKNDISQKINNIKTTKQYSILLPEVDSKVNDRKDIIIRLALELFYDDATQEREILIKRDALKVVAQKVLKNKDLNEFRKTDVSEQLRVAMNSLFDKETLKKIIIKEFRIEKVDAQ